MNRLDEIRQRINETGYRNALQTHKDAEYLLAELERVTAERDAAIRDLSVLTGCKACKHRHSEKCDNCNEADNWLFKWRGLEATENGK